MLRSLLSWVRRVLAPMPGETPNLFAASSAVLGIAAVYFYFTGYIFSYFYYQAFGVTLESLDLSSQYYFVHSYSVFQTVGGAAVLCAVLVVVLLYMGSRLRRGIMLAALLVAFPLLYTASEHAAVKDYSARRCSPSATFQFRFKEEKKAAADPATAKKLDGPAPTVAEDSDSMTNDDLQKLSDAGGLFLLLETKERVVVYQKPDCAFYLKLGTSVPAVHAYTLLRGDLSFSLVVAP